jgi:thiosulfate dehydrogenase [quinone] large subunit
MTLQPTHFLLLLPIRVFLAAGWLRAGIEKLVDPDWWSGDGLRTFLDEHRATALPPFRPVMEHAIQPFALTVAFVVVATEIGCGIALMAGRPLRAALRWAVVLNVTFMLCGEINPSSFYLVMEMVLLAAVADGTIGTRPTPPRRRTYVFAAALLLVGGALVPYIRSLEPAEVITDPAIMLLFLALLQAATLVLRCSLAKTGTRSSTSSSVWSHRLTSWAKARPSPRAPRSVDMSPGQRATEPQVVSALGWRRSP